ncbi:MAG TPA: GNAT family N-acetyltransferase [Thermoanaerobaculia bacterium]|jgi:phosphinothricin acetyltransferase
MALSLRSATTADAVGIHAIYAPIVARTAISFELEPPDVAEVAKRIETTTAKYPWLVYADGETLAGYAYASAFRPRPAYNRTAEVSIAIAESHRGRGLAVPLYEALLSELARRGFHTAVAVINLPNDASRALHRRAGFEPVGVLHEVGYKFGEWRDIELWERRLTT